MTAQLRQKKYYSFEEYLVLEAKADFKHEYLNGKIVQMAGAKTRHSDIFTNIYVYLGMIFIELDDKYRLANSDVKVYMDEYNKARYPDIIIMEDPYQYHDNSESVIVNPKAVIEILSPSTAKRDKGEKFDEYKSLATFDEYILVEQDKPQVTVHTKEADGTWVNRTTTNLQESIILRSLGVEMPMQRIYRKIKFE